MEGLVKGFARVAANGRRLEIALELRLRVRWLADRRLRVNEGLLL